MSHAFGRLSASLVALTVVAVLIATGVGALKYSQAPAVVGGASPSPVGVANASCWRGDYEPGTRWDRVEMQGLPKKANGPTRVTKPVRQGRYSAGFTVLSGGASQTAQRIEVVRTQHFVEGTDTWMAWSIYLPRGQFRIDPGRDVVITEWVDNPPPYLGPPEIQTLIRNIGGANRIALAARGGNEQELTDREWTFGPIPEDQWVDLALHVRWASTDEGLIEFWIDGQKVLAKQTPTIYQKRAVYLRQGISREASTITSTVYEDATVVSAEESGLSCPSAPGVRPSATPGGSNG
jgi:hypothetical protein